METQKTSQTLYTGKIVTLQRDEVFLPNGKTAIREVIRHRGAVAIVPLTEEKEVIVVQQCRYPFQQILTEIPAGKMESCEDPLECAKRELLEETGATAKEFLFLGDLYPSPAILDEVIHLYMATGLEFQSQHLDEDEFIEVKRIPLETLVEQIQSGEIKDAKTQAALLKVYVRIARDSIYPVAGNILP